MWTEIGVLPGPRPPTLGVMDAVEIARIGPDDWRELRVVRLASLSDAPTAFGARLADWADAPEARWRQRLTDVPFTVVARTPSGPVGVVSGAATEDTVELISMWVAPGHRGTGLAGRLVGEVVEWAAGCGRDTFLMVRDDNVVAVRAYEKAGFVDLGVPEDRPEGAPLERRMRHDRRREAPGVRA